jgi:hypothetical protein
LGLVASLGASGRLPTSAEIADSASEMVGSDNTKRTYKAPQKEFIAWLDRRFGDQDVQMRYCVTSEKLCQFLVTEVMGRPVRGPSAKEGRIIGKSTVNNYVTAITSIWAQQHARRVRFWYCCLVVGAIRYTKFPNFRQI